MRPHMATTSLAMHLNSMLGNSQSSGLVRHVFRLLERAMAKRQPVQMVLLENVRH